MKFRGGVSCHAERLMELEEGTFPAKRHFPYALLCCELIKPFTFYRKYFDPNEDGAFDSYGSAGGEYDPYDYMTGEQLFIILHRGSISIYRKSILWFWDPSTCLSIFGSCKSITIENYTSLIFHSSHSHLVNACRCGYPLIGNEISQLRSRCGHCIIHFCIS